MTVYKLTVLSRPNRGGEQLFELAWRGYNPALARESRRCQIFRTNVAEYTKQLVFDGHAVVNQPDRIL